MFGKPEGITRLVLLVWSFLYFNSEQKDLYDFVEEILIYSGSTFCSFLTIQVSIGFRTWDKSYIPFYFRVLV